MEPGTSLIPVLRTQRRVVPWENTSSRLELNIGLPRKENKVMGGLVGGWTGLWEREPWGKWSIGIRAETQSALEKLPKTWRLYPPGCDLGSGALKTGQENGKNEAGSPP